MQKICVDAGVLSIYFSDDTSKKVMDLIQKIKQGEYKCFLLGPVLIEVYWNICKFSGIESARILLSNFLRDIPHEIVPANESLIYTAGKIKCQHRTTLSYNDCMSIAFCLKNNITFHTHEKNLKKIPYNTLERLKIARYSFK